MMQGITMLAPPHSHCRDAQKVLQQTQFPPSSLSHWSWDSMGSRLLCTSSNPLTTVQKAVWHFIQIHKWKGDSAWLNEKVRAWENLWINTKFVSITDWAFWYWFSLSPVHFPYCSQMFLLNANLPLSFSYFKTPVTPHCFQDKVQHPFCLKLYSMWPQLPF